MDTNQPIRQAGAQPSVTESAPLPISRSANGRNLCAATLVGFVLLVVQSVAYHHYEPTDGSVGQDVPVYLVAALIGALVAGIGLLRVVRSRNAATRPRVGVMLAVLGLIVFPVAYFTPLTFIWGATAYLLSREAQPGPLRTAARVLGIVALCLTPLVVLARVAGITYQVGG